MTERKLIVKAHALNRCFDRLGFKKLEEAKDYIKESLEDCRVSTRGYDSKLINDETGLVLVVDHRKDLDVIVTIYEESSSRFMYRNVNSNRVNFLKGKKLIFEKQKKRRKA